MRAPTLALVRALAPALALALALLPGAAHPESLIALRTIAAGVILSPGDIGIAPKDIAGALQDPEAVIGTETRVVLYAGRPIRAQDIGPPAIVDRNQMVTLIYQRGPLTIVADGRALARGGIGDMVRVMNLDSRNTVSGVVTESGAILVAPDRTAHRNP